MRKKMISLLVVLFLLLFVSCDVLRQFEIKTYTVTFDSQGGSEVVALKVNENNTLEEMISNPIKSNASFKFWSKDGTTAFDLKTPITEDMTLKAVWEFQFKLGDIGPAGGYIFYDCDADNSEENDGAGPDGLSSEKDGWRYLEAAKEYLNVYYTYSWGMNGAFGTEIGIGKGKSNTRILADKGKTCAAAYAVWNQTINGFSDWFIPSKDELSLILNLVGVRGDWFDACWSSSEYDDNYAWCKENYQGYQVGYRRSSGRCILPVREF